MGIPSLNGKQIRNPGGGSRGAHYAEPRSRSSVSRLFSIDCRTARTCGAATCQFPKTAQISETVATWLSLN